MVESREEDAEVEMVDSVDVRVVDLGGITEVEVRSHTPKTHNDTKMIVVIVDE